MISESEGPVVTEITGGSGFYEYLSVAEIQGRVKRKSGELRVAIGEYRDDHIYVLRIDSLRA